MVTLYDKQRQGRPAADFTYIDYGLSALARRVIADEMPGRPGGPGGAVQRAQRARRAGGPGGRERFYEIGSPAGLEDFEEWAAAKR